MCHRKGLNFSKSAKDSIIHNNVRFCAMGQETKLIPQFNSTLLKLFSSLENPTMLTCSTPEGKYFEGFWKALQVLAL